MITESVRRAIDEIRQAFAGTTVDYTEDGQGGARVVVKNLELGKQYTPESSSVAFPIGFQYPACDVYPHFILAELKRVDGAVLGQSFGPGEWLGTKGIQVSRRSNRWRADLDTAAIKLQKVLEWIRSR